MAVKKVIKSIVPQFFLNWYHDVHLKYIINHDFKLDKEKYEKYATFDDLAANESNMQATLIFHAHAIEKGLSHANFRPNFGKKALSGIKLNLDKFVEENYDQNSFAYKNAVSVLKAYKLRHQQAKIETPYFDALFPEKLYINAENIAGAKEEQKKDFNEVPFSELVNLRKSVREFSEETVDLEIVKSCVAQAITTPSVCNRQPWKVYLTDNKDKIKKILQLQGGFKGYELPPVLSFITTSVHNFRGPGERNEGYIDGGLFLMNFLYALTDKKLATCTLNAMQSTDKLAKICSLLDVPDAELPIAFVIIGHYPERYKLAASARKPLNEVCRVRND